MEHRTYGADMKAGGRIAAVVAGGPADRAGVSVGDSVISVDGVPVTDVLDWQWKTEGFEAMVTVSRADGSQSEVLLRRSPDEAWGLSFESPVFDRVRTCMNNCTFCFMTQLPKGLRPSLYVRDDDYRLSFLHGNFITLTNLTGDDVDRIIEQRLSPLYVSLHAVDPDVRAELICAREDRALERFDQLLDGGIDLHVQIVLVPGVNDADELDRTLTWLAEREGVASVGIVPLGYTAHQDVFSASYGEQMAALTVIQQVQRWQFAMRERDSVTWVYLADEFYLSARAPFPTTEWYDDFPQFDNGIGMVRTFADEAAALHSELKEAAIALPETDSVTIVTSMMAATTIAGALGACDAAGRVRLLVVPNRFFGGNVAVTGLLTGRDISDAIVRDDNPGLYLVPDVVLNSDGVTLDDMTAAEMSQRSGAILRLVSSDAAGLLGGLHEAAQLLSAGMKE